MQSPGAIPQPAVWSHGAPQYTGAARTAQGLPGMGVPFVSCAAGR
eukprot:COSAG04_NODE_19478_length_415_cov_1.170886_1_plen_44_part_10